MRFALSPYLGTGTGLNPFVTIGREQPRYSSIDLRPDCTRPDGFALIAAPERIADPRLIDLGDDADSAAASIRRLLGSRLSLTLAAADLRHLVAEILLAHARWDGTRWKPLRATVQGWLEIHLGGLLWRKWVMAGGSSLSESFNTADSDTLGPDQTWTEVVGDWDINSNRASLFTQNTNSSARIESDLASVDHYCQVTVAALDSPTGGQAVTAGAIARFASAATTFYTAQIRHGASSDEAEDYKVVAGTYTAIGVDDTITWASTDTIRVECNGSTIKRYYNGAEQDSVTDTAITTGTRVGIHGFRGVSTAFSCEVDTLTAADLAADPGADPATTVIALVMMA